MWALVIHLILLISANGAAQRADVSILPGSHFKRPVGADFNLTCRFILLTSKQFAQMFKQDQHKDECLINMTSTVPNVTITLNIDFATTTDTGTYSCKTYPIDAISPQVNIQITEESMSLSQLSVSRETVSAPERLPGHHMKGSQSTPLTTMSNQRLCHTDQARSKAGDNTGLLVSSLHGQMWYWMLLGKAVILLLTLAYLIIQYKTG